MWMLMSFFFSVSWIIEYSVCLSDCLKPDFDHLPLQKNWKKNQNQARRQVEKNNDE